MAFARTIYFAAFCAVGLGGCSIFPADGPATMDVRAGQQDPEGLQYELIKVTPQTLETLAKFAPRLTGAFPDRRPPKGIALGTGDVVRVSIFEAGSGGLFIPAEASVRPGNFVDLPAQLVDNKGNITVPYCPPVRAAGRSTEDVQRSIVEALKSRAVEPQVVVTVGEQRTSLISVLGDVKAANRFPANREGEHLLDAIARAGGPANQGFDEWVMLERGGRRASVPLGAVLYQPSNNIWVHPNDTIFLYREPQTFLAFGATGHQAAGSGAYSALPVAGSPNTLGSQLPFDSWRISLAEAVAKSGGLNDDRADPASVFLYRGETRQAAQLLGIDVKKYEGPIIPVIYMVDLRDPAGFFLATKFEMRNKDVIYVSNSFSVESSKALAYMRLVVGTMNDPIVAAVNALTVRNLAGAATATTAVAVGGAAK